MLTTKSNEDSSQVSPSDSAAESHPDSQLDNLAKTQTLSSADSHNEEPKNSTEEPGSFHEPEQYLPVLISEPVSLPQREATIDPPARDQTLQYLTRSVEKKTRSTKRKICGLSLTVFLVIIFLIALAVGLGAGLGAGLKSKDNSSGASLTSSSASATTTGAFSSHSAFTSSSSLPSSSLPTATATILAARETSIARDVIQNNGSIEASFCTSDSNVLGFLQANLTVQLMDFQFYTAYWIDGSDAGVTRQMTTNKTEIAEIDEETSVISTFATGQVELGSSYRLRISFKYVIDIAYDDSAVCHKHKIYPIDNMLTYNIRTRRRTIFR